VSSKPALHEVTLDQVWYSFDRMYACLSFRMKGVLLPVWVSGNTAQCLERRLLQRPNRPEAIDLLFDRIEDAGVDKIAITGYSEGVFYSSVFLKDGEEIDCRPTDALIIADIVEQPIFVSDTVVEECAFSVDEDTDIVDLFEGTEELSSPSTHVDAGTAIDISDDDEFSALMTDLGFSENDLRLGMEDLGPDDGAGEGDEG